MHGVLDPFRDPVSGECDKHNEPDDLRDRTAAGATRLARGVGAITVRLVLDVYGD